MGTSRLTSLFESKIEEKTQEAGTNIIKPGTSGKSKISAIWQDKFELEPVKTPERTASLKKTHTVGGFVVRSGPVANKWTPKEHEVKKTVADTAVVSDSGPVANKWTPHEYEVKKTVVELPTTAFKEEEEDQIMPETTGKTHHQESSGPPPDHSLPKTSPPPESHPTHVPTSHPTTNHTQEKPTTDKSEPQPLIPKIASHDNIQFLVELDDDAGNFHIELDNQHVSVEQDVTTDQTEDFQITSEHTPDQLEFSLISEF